MAGGARGSSSSNHSPPSPRSAPPGPHGRAATLLQTTLTLLFDGLPEHWNSGGQGQARGRAPSPPLICHGPWNRRTGADPAHICMRVSRIEFSVED